MIAQNKIEPPIGIPTLNDSFYVSLKELLEYVDSEVVADGAESMPKEIQQACAAVLVPPSQHAALVLLKFLHTHSSATNEEEETMATEKLKEELLQVAKEFKAILDIQKRFAIQTIGTKYVPKD